MYVSLMEMKKLADNYLDAWMNFQLNDGEHLKINRPMPVNVMHSTQEIVSQRCSNPSEIVKK